MKCFHTTTYELKNKDKLKICIINDIHFSTSIKDEKLNKIISYIKDIKPDYLLIPGDLVDSTNEIELDGDRLKKWILELSKSTKLIISLGNHDCCSIINKKAKYNYNEEFYNDLSKQKNVFVLDNSIYEDKKIYICGITNSFKYYHHEDMKIMLKDLSDNKEIISNLPDKLKIILIHSPINLNDKKIKDELKEFDYIICGHMHNGCVPPIFNELFKSTRGIITPNKKLFRKMTRNTFKLETDKIIVNGPITTFQKKSGLMQVFNFMYPSYISIMTFSKNNEFNINRKYHKFK